MARVHRDVEFYVARADGKGRPQVFGDFDRAAERAVHLAITWGAVVLDTIVWTRAGAKALGGDDAVEQYEEDPDASVFDRVEINANVVGRVP